MTKFSMLSRCCRKQSGQALIAILVFMGIGGILLAPLLNYIGTSLIAGQTYQNKAEDYYAADAGIVDAQWQLKKDRLNVLFPSPTYDQYNFGNPTWGSTISGSGGWYYPSAVGNYDGLHKAVINDSSVAVQIKNLWVPSNITTPDAATARSIAETSKLVVTGRDTGQIYTTARQFEITVTFFPDASDALKINTFGVWLPPGFVDIVGDASHGLQLNGSSSYPSVARTTTPNANGTCILWTFSSPTLLSSLPGVGSGDNPMTLTITFWYKYNSPGLEISRIAQAIGWATTSGVADTSYSWDADTHVVSMTSKATSTSVDAIVIREETRQLGEAVNGDYFATGNSLLSPTTNQAYRDRFYSSSTATIASTDIPANAKVEAVYLYWSGWIDWHNYNPLGAHDTIVLSDDCSNFTSPPLTWTAGSRWTVPINSGHFQVQGSSSASTDAQRTLTSSAIPGLGAYSGQTVVLSWTQSGAGVDPNDYMYFKLSNGVTDTGWLEAFHGTNTPTSPFVYTIPQAYLTNSTTLSYYVSGSPTTTNTWTSTGDYAYIDNISITVPQIFFDDGSSLGKWTVSSGTWNINNNQIRGYGSSSVLTQTTSLNLSSYSGVSLAVSLDILKGTFSATDHLYIAFNGGGNWSSDIELPVNLTQTSSSNTYTSYLIPDAYKTNNFKMRFKVTGSSSHYVYLDNITVSGPSLKYPANGTQANVNNLVDNVAKVNKVTFGTGGNTQTITADTVQTLPNGYGAVDSGFIGTWSYCAMADVTSLVNGWITAGQASANGAANYTLGQVIAANTEDPSYSFNLYGGGSTGYPLGTPALSQSGTLYQYSYCGWSMIVVYSSPETKGHQLWLYDISTPGFTFAEAWADAGIPNPDFDGDGVGGGTVSGFLVPQGIELENDSSKISVFVLEGDVGITGDQFIVTGQDGTSQALSDATSSANNVWDSNSPGLSHPGIDLDTFYVNYPVLKPGDVSAKIDLPTQHDGFLLGYIIISFRSDTTTGGAISYLIH